MSTPLRSWLTCQLDPGFGPISFARPSANASVVDHLGVLQFALSGEARFVGARRVCNLIADSEALSSGWTLGAGTTKAPAGTTSPNHARASAWAVTRSGASAVMLTLDAQGFRPGKLTFSAWLRGDGGASYTLAIGAATQTFTLPAGVWRRCVVSADIPDGAPYACSITSAQPGAATFTVCDPQLEYTHGQASPAPGEYVPRGVASLPADQLTAGVDGVRYFETVNPWSVASGIATAIANPALIDWPTLKGLLLEPATTNLLWDSGSLATARWARTGSTTVNATPLDSTALGPKSLWKVEEAAVNEGHRISQSSHGSVPAASSVVSGSVYAKAAERSVAYMGLRGLDGSTLLTAYFNLATGAVSNVEAGVVASMRRVGDLWLLMASRDVGASGASVPLMNFGCCETAGTAQYLGTAGSGMWFGGAQLEIGAVASSYVGNTAAAATLARASDICSLDSAVPFPSNSLTVSVDFTPFYPTGTVFKEDWWYVWYSHTTTTDRFGLSLRPGLRGGFTDAGADDWAFDLYPESLTWDGVDITSGQVPSVGSTVRTQWSLGTATQTGLSNQAAYVGTVRAGTPLGADNIGVQSVVTPSRTVFLGRSRANDPQRGPAAFKNLTYLPEALTPAQMLQAATGRPEVPAAAAPTFYATQADLEARFSQVELIQITDSGNSDGTVDQAKLVSALQDADAEIDAYLQARYALPLASVPRLLVNIACDIARYRLYDDRATDQVTRRYDDALKLLGKIAKGEIQLGLNAATQATPVTGGPSFTAPSRVFSRSKLSDYTG